MWKGGKEKFQKARRLKGRERKKKKEGKVSRIRLIGKFDPVKEFFNRTDNQYN